MKKGDYQEKKGFTIIEVSLVLAIAGLIFLMVFVALPQLQRQQRDSRRRDDILSFLETVKKYQTNNRGALPEEDQSCYKSSCSGYTEATWNNSNSSSVSANNWKGFYRDYLGENFIDPSGGHYSLMVMQCSNVFGGKYCQGPTYADDASGYKALRGNEATFPNYNRLYVILQAECEGSMAIKTSNPRKVAVLYRMEGAGVYCANT